MPAIFFLLVALLATFEFVAVKIPQNLSQESSEQYVYSITGYILPNTAELLYSQKYWPEGSEPMTVCSVFKLTKKDFREVINFRFFSEDEYLTGAILENKGCNNFQEKEMLFDSYFQAGSYLRGYTIRINRLEKLVMFEMYLYD